MKRDFRICLLLGAFLCLASCSSSGGATLSASSEAPSSSTDEEEAKIRDIYELYVKNATSKGETPLSYEEWLASIKGEKGDKGDPGADGKDGKDGRNGEDGKSGQDGEDGKSAYEIYKEAHPEYEGDEQQWLDDLVNGRLGSKEKEMFTVTFDLGYDNLSFTQEIEKGEKAKKPKNPERNGYDFLDWVDENGDHWFFNGFCITENLTLHAVWSDPIEYTVTFVNNGGTVLDIQNGFFGETVTYGGETPVAEKQDAHYKYTFSGWDKELVITGDMTITAQYVSNDIATTAYYFDYDGQTLLATVPLAEGEQPHYDGVTPTRARDKTNKLQFEFEGWDKVEETADTIKFVARFSACTDGLDIEGDTVVYYHGTSADVVIPSKWGGDSIRDIKEKAFDNCFSLASVSIPEGVASIGDHAFSDCFSLASVTIPSTVTSIGDHAFYGCSSLASVTIPEGVASIGDHAFDGCSSLSSVTIPSSVAFIGEGAFASCPSLASVSIPEGVASIGDRAFSGCSSLSSVAIPTSVTSIGAYAFYGCSSLASVTIPEGVASIGDWAFYGCSFASVSIPEGVTSIGDLAFSGCSSLASITVDPANPVYDSRGGCNAIIETATGALVVGCSSTVIPEGVTSIGYCAFCGCSSLSSVTIPSSVTSIGDYAFADCSSLASITVDPANPVYDSRGGCNAIIETATGALVVGCSATVIPEGVASIGDRAFYCCSSLASVSIPEGVASIGDDAFYRCSSLASVTIPSSVTSIGDYAFADCSSLASVTIPSSVTSIGESAFPGRPSSFVICCEAEHKPMGWSDRWNINGLARVVWGFEAALTQDGLRYAVREVDGERSAVLIGYEGKPTEAIMPKAVDGAPLVSIPSYAFSFCSSLTSVTIPEGVASIGDHAFDGCSSLASVAIPSSVTSIGDHAFADCSSLESVTIPEGVTSIGSSAFSGCSSLTSIIIPEGVKSIGRSAFSGCSSLSSITIPSSVTSIGDWAFYGCSSLTIIRCETEEKPSGWSDNWKPGKIEVVWGYKDNQ